MISFIKAFLTKTSNNNWCYSSQPRTVANGFLGSGGSITSFSKGQDSSGQTHYMWLPDGTDTDALSASNPVIYLECKDSVPTGIYLSQGEYDAQTVAPSAQPVQQQAV